MKLKKTDNADPEIIVSDTFFKIASGSSPEVFYYKNLKEIRIKSGKTNYLGTALSWVVDILFNITAANIYRDEDYLEIITKDNKSMHKELMGFDRKKLKKSLTLIKKNIKQ